MTAWLASTTVSVYRDSDTTDVNDFGDETETGPRLIAERVPAAVSEIRERSFNLSDLRTDHIVYQVIRLLRSVPVAMGDTVRDEQTGLSYTVTLVSRPASIVGLSTVRIEARRSGS